MTGEWRYTFKACRDTSYLGYYDCEDGVNIYLRLIDPCEANPNTIDTDLYTFDEDEIISVCGFDPFCSGDSCDDNGGAITNSAPYYFWYDEPQAQTVYLEKDGQTYALPEP